MRTISGPLALLLLFWSGFGLAAAGDGPQLGAGAASAQPPSQSAGAADSTAGAAEVDASSVILPCIPVAAYWTGPPQSEGMPPGPELAIVSIDVRPKNARVYLDDRFVGRARYLDGKPGYLYLVPGSYRVELRLDGYEPVAIAVEAVAGCRFDLKHRLERVPGTKKEQKSDNHGKGKPFNRVYAPPGEVEGAVSASPAGPDPGLRPDLGDVGPTVDTNRPTGASLKVSITPVSASMAIDGVFVATAQELQRMQGPLAVTSGSHLIEISAAGFQTFLQRAELEDGEVLELSVELAESPPAP
jgi:hypothetical protein